MKSIDVRKKFFDYFVQRKHERVPSSSLIPAQDPTLLFTNAGMNQFKDAFLGKEKRSYRRAVSIQKCVRAGGKHNDLDNVGFTKRHLTFFEMMGNFSFGDYFKKEAIPFAWNFLTKELGLDPEDLCVSVHHTDDEAFEIWHKDIGLPKAKIYRCGDDNFWQMGDVGPCGPSTEIFFDREARNKSADPAATPETDGERFLEIWNVVFMQYNRQEDGTDIPLQQTGVDTGMGLERVMLILQNKDTVYETDIFEPLIKKIELLTGQKYATAPAHIKAACNVIADHVRSVSLLLADGCAPSNEGRGYVLRKIIRRAALFAQKLTSTPIFVQIAETFIATMSSIYPELAQAKDRILAVIAAEVERFSQNLERGQVILETYFEENKDRKVITGKQAFTLYDTYGFPFEVTDLLSRERGFSVSRKEFEQHMEKQRALSGKKMKQQHQELDIPEHITTVFTGYTSLKETGTVKGLVVEDALVDTVPAGCDVWVIADKTPFYVECGGQVNDQGLVCFGQDTTKLLDLKNNNSAILMRIVSPVDLYVGQAVTMEVDSVARQATMKNHTATHLLQAALQELFGKQVRQAGSVVQPELLRFDFTYHKPLSAEELVAIEEKVNQKIWENIPLRVEHTTYKEALKNGVIAFFGDKYNPDDVRAVTIPGFSAELCGGTHVSATGDIGMFKIVEETALAAGQRRIVAYTGPKALQEFQTTFALTKQLSRHLKVKPQSIIAAVTNLQDSLKQTQKDLQQVKAEKVQADIVKLYDQVEHIKDYGFGVFELKDATVNDLRAAMQKLQAYKPGLYALLAKNADKKIFVVARNKQLSDIKLSEVKAELQDLGLRGGGNDQMIQGGVASKTSIDVIAKVLKNLFFS